MDPYVFLYSGPSGIFIYKNYFHFNSEPLFSPFFLI